MKSLFAFQFFFTEGLLSFSFHINYFNRVGVQIEVLLFRQRI